MNLEFSKLIENVESMYVFANENLLKFPFTPNQHDPTIPMNMVKVVCLV
jgi:hypothetical protein